MLLGRESRRFEPRDRTDREIKQVEIAVALTRYRLAAGAYPERLDDLVPKYLSKVSLDPVDGQPMRYARKNGAAVVYSIGSDGKDDDGNVTGTEFERPTDDGFIINKPS